MTSSQIALATLIAEHQEREVELRRRQNVVAREHPIGYVGVVDASFLDQFEPDKGIDSGVIPVSELTWSSWHVGSNIPFVMLPENNPVLAPQRGEIVTPWFRFMVTSSTGVLCVTPDGDRRLVRWNEEVTPTYGSFYVGAFKTTEEAQAWVRTTTTRMTS